VSEKFVTFARQRDAMVAVVSLASEEETGPRCALVPRRIEEVRESVCASAPAVAGAWRTLAWSRLDEAPAVAAAMIVLLETVPTDERGAPRLQPPPPRRPFVRTSAHPRGVPEPRSARPRAADLRGSLATQASWLAVRQALNGQRRRAFRMLREAGYDERRLAALSCARDPYAAYHHAAPAEAGLAALPRLFRTSMLPLLRGRAWPEVMRCLSLYRELGLGDDAELLALVARLLAISLEHGPRWCASAVTQVPERRRAFVRALLRTGASAANPERLDPGALGALASLDAARYDDRLTFLLESLCAGYPAEHALDGFRVADEFAPEHEFVARWCQRLEVPFRRRVPLASEPVLRPVLDHIGPAMTAEGSRAFSLLLWERCAHDPAFARVLRQPAVMAWSGGSALGVLRELVYEHRLPPDEYLRAIEPLLAAVPQTHHGKAIGAVGELFIRWRGAEERRHRLPVACALLGRLARPPFRADGGWGTLVALLVEAALPARTGRLLSAPEACLVRLEAALREHEAWLTTQGLEALARRTGGLLVDALIRSPEALFATARMLGCLRRPRRLAVLNRYRANPIAQRSFLKRPLEQMSRMLEPLVRDGLANPVPRRLRHHLAGRIALTPSSVERHRQAVERGMLPLKLGLLRRLALADLGRGLPVEPGRADERHALQMVGTIDTNRRILRRVLRVEPAARRDFLLAHPANRAWLRKHPRVDAALWTHGIEQAARDGHGPLRLAIETEPLAVLRLGTEVGSCLSVGGCWADSAVAVMVDVNKQVIFARRPDGTFVARQLVALGEDERLVFFPVYPLSAAAEVNDAFHRYDLAFAAALGLQPFEQRGDDTYDIAPVLARAFYDDGPWDRFAVQ
jgi:hypothetical protein